VKHHFKPAPVAAHHEPAKEVGPHQQPHGYTIPGHCIKIFETDAYKQAAKDEFSS